MSEAKAARKSKGASSVKLANKQKQKKAAPVESKAEPAEADAEPNALLQEILELGGDEADLELVKGVDSDAEEGAGKVRADATQPDVSFFNFSQVGCSS